MSAAGAASGASGASGVGSDRGSGVWVFVRLRPRLASAASAASASADEARGAAPEPPQAASQIEVANVPKDRPGIITLRDPLSAGRSEHSYEFDGIIPAEWTQEQVFPPVAGPAVEAAVRGQGSCVMAYGQTGSGKTFSIFGEGRGARRGLLPRSLEKLFEQLNEGGGPGSVSVSFLEVYLDRLRDLGAPDYAGDFAESTAARGSLEVREGPNGVHVKGLTRLPARDLSEVQLTIDRGLARRATGKTAANVVSSRSHTVFTVHIPRSWTRAGEAAPSDSVALSFVDLAGSERLAKSKAEGIRFQEAVAINSSLTALGKVVLSLSSDPEAPKHVPFRESKLTRILSKSLCAGAHVTVLATLHPRVEDYEESLNTLSFAYRCKNVVRLPQVTSISTKKNMQRRAADLQAQVLHLKEQLRLAQQDGARVSAGLGPAGGDKLDTELAHMITARRDSTGLSDGATPLVNGHMVTEASSTRVGDSSIFTDGAATSVDERRRKSCAPSSRSLLEASPAQASEAPASSGWQRHVAQLPEMQEERRRQVQAHERADQRLQALDRERQWVMQQEEARQIEAQSLRQRAAELQRQLEKAQAELQGAVQQRGRDRDRQLKELQESRERHLQDTSGAILNISAQLQEERGKSVQRKGMLDEWRQQSEEEHFERLRALKQWHAGELQALEKRLVDELAAKEEQCQRQQQQLGELRAHQELTTKRCHEELLSLSELAAALARIVAAVEDGRHPTLVRQSGLRSAVLRDGLKPPLPTAQTHKTAFEALQRGEEFEAAFKRLEQPVPGGDYTRRSTCGGIAAFAAHRRAPPQVDLDVTQPRGRVGPEVAELGAGGSGSTWDAAEHCRKVCEAKARPDVERLLDGLSPAQLRQLCKELNSEAVAAFPMAAERQRLRSEALEVLGSSVMEARLQELQEARAEERTALAVTVTRGKQLRSSLWSRRSGSFCNDGPLTASQQPRFATSRRPVASED